jgi:hypothetical protein
VRFEFAHRTTFLIHLRTVERCLSGHEWCAVNSFGFVSEGDGTECIISDTMKPSSMTAMSNCRS